MMNDALGGEQLESTELSNKGGRSRRVSMEHGTNLVKEMEEEAMAISNQSASVRSRSGSGSYHHFQTAFPPHARRKLSMDASSLVSVQEEGEMGEASARSSSGTPIRQKIIQQSMNIQNMSKRTIVVALLVVLIGAAAAFSFMYIGITAAKQDQDNEFENRARDAVEEIEGAWEDYETTVKWMHESCRYWREANLTREDFNAQYQYAISDGLDFFGVQFVPNVSHAQRLTIEEEAAQYFNTSSLPEHASFTYSGFKGVEPDPSDPSGTSIQKRSIQPFYFPILFVEPFDAFGTHLDLWSSPYERPTIAKALETGVPTLTPAFQLLGDGEEEGVGLTVVLYHPGVSVREEAPRDLNNVLLRIHALLERASRGQQESLAIYLYDVTDTNNDPTIPPSFLGAGHPIHDHEHQHEQDHNHSHSIHFYEETAYDTLVDSHQDLYYEEHVLVGGRSWHIVVVPVDEAYQSDIRFVVLSGCLIFVASVCLALWMLNNMRRSIQMQQVMAKAAAEATIVSNLFPENVKKRLIADAALKAKVEQKNNPHNSSKLNREYSFQGDITEAKLKNYLSSEGIFGSKPIAELYPSTTLLFADLVGFTAWSSVREPSQVFTLLEIIYHSFDNIAVRRGIFKVETVGDCYVAAAGLPEPRDDHAVAMSRFASDCLSRLQKLVKALDTRLGPDTGDLDLRVGLHSGPVTAGVLRGEKGRFQLFGDTMNTASRMESTGIKGKIQISEETADLLRAAGKEKWIFPRKDEVKVKGKGMMKTWYLKIGNKSETDTDSVDTKSLVVSEDTPMHDLNDENYKIERMVDWNVEVLSDLLKKIVGNNHKKGKIATPVNPIFPSGDTTLFDEVKEVIALQEFNEKVLSPHLDTNSIELERDVLDQLHCLVSRIASLYSKNPFHSFEHASHVAMSVLKMGGRIVEAKQCGARRGTPEVEREVYNATFGIAHDPMIQFACVFSALIHDLDHQGVPNATLVQERAAVALKYNNQSVAEQNSVDLAWNLLQDSQYEKLRSCIFVDQDEYRRFREMVVNIVLATDILDRQLGAARKERWNKAFGEGGASQVEEAECISLHRKATIVLEHVIQASDISHTMQHWHIFIKWNQRLFHEMYRAFKEGRIDKDPSVHWYTGEMGFFDFYIIPLAKKLETCGVFGVSSDEYLNYAVINRKEWEKKGRRMVKEYLIKYKELYEDEADTESQPRDRSLLFCENSNTDLDLSDLDL